MTTAPFEHVDALVRGYVDRGDLAGAICVVTRRDQVAHFGVYGRQDVERDRPMRADTIFRVYSMTKPIASVALMMLYERGRFQLTDPIGEYLPSLAELPVLDGDLRPATRQVTIRDLLMHTSGMVGPHARGAVGDLYRRADVGRRRGTLAEMVAALGRLPLAADPGTRWIYGISTDVVGRLIEVLDGRPFDRYLAEEIFEPLGMPDTGFGVPPAETGRFAACYGPGLTLLDDPATSTYVGPQTYFSGSAGLVSTAADYLRFTRMLANGGELDGRRVLGPRTLRFMTTNHLPEGRDLTRMAQHGGESQREGHGFGLGFGVLLDPTVAQTIGSPGEYFWGGAASTTFFISPADALTTIFLTQLRPSTTYPIRRQLRAAVYAALTD